MTSPIAEPLETTAEERDTKAKGMNCSCLECRIARDIDRLLAQVEASAKRIAELEKERDAAEHRAGGSAAGRDWHIDNAAELLARVHELEARLAAPLPGEAERLAGRATREAASIREQFPYHAHADLLDETAALLRRQALASQDRKDGEAPGTPEQVRADIAQPGPSQPVGRADEPAKEILAALMVEVPEAFGAPADDWTEFGWEWNFSDGSALWFDIAQSGLSAYWRKRGLEAGHGASLPVIAKPAPRWTAEQAIEQAAKCADEVIANLRRGAEIVRQSIAVKLPIGSPITPDDLFAEKLVTAETIASAIRAIRPPGEGSK